MKSSWQGNPGQLTCRWSEVGQRVEYNLRRMGEASDGRGSYLPPPTDFPSHSPLGGAEWFEPHGPVRDAE
jgi:hypothetical protein